jgi:hypothetical protein
MMPPSLLGICDLVKLSGNGQAAAGMIMPHRGEFLEPHADNEFLDVDFLDCKILLSSISFQAVSCPWGTCTSLCKLML